MSWRARIVLSLLCCAVLLAAALGWMRWRSARNPGEVAVEEAWLQVQRSPRDPALWSRLGDAQARYDENAAAEHAYRTALRLGSRDASLKGRLGFLLYGAGRDHEARELLTEARAGGAQLPMLDWTLAELEAAAQREIETSAVHEPEPQLQPQPEERPRRIDSGAGTPVVTAEEPEVHEVPEEPEEGTELCAIDAVSSRHMGTLRVPVEIGGEIYWMIVDTGASITVVSAQVVEELDLEIDSERAVRAITATGPATFERARVPSLSVADRVVEDLWVAVCEGCGGQDSVGLLGLDVQAAIGAELRVGTKQLVFTDCEE
jgi:hypothetical protein